MKKRFGAFTFERESRWLIVRLRPSRWLVRVCPDLAAWPTAGWLAKVVAIVATSRSPKPCHHVSYSDGDRVEPRVETCGSAIVAELLHLVAA